MHASTSLLLVSLLSIPLNAMGGTPVRASVQSVSSATSQQLAVSAVNTTDTSDDCAPRGCGRRHDKGRGSGRIEKLSTIVPSFSTESAFPSRDAIAVRGSGRIDVNLT
ncbi:MAG: hypothetical protein SW833_12390 [Cyanobacteriota bacterium]|nr:hypothetical protein [Cyanobacteriota bacterium]